MSNTLSLATRLRALNDTELAQAMRDRGIPSAGIKDFFDLAEAFLDRASIQQMLTRLGRDTLTVLAAIAQLTEESGPPTARDIQARLESIAGTAPSLAAISERAAVASALLLLEAESKRFAAYESVREQLRSWPAFGLPGLTALASGSAPPALAPVPDVDRRFIDRLGAERAFTAVTAVTELLSEVERDPARELAKGGVALPDTKRLASAMAVELQDVPAFVAMVARAGLIARDGGAWVITTAGLDWLLESTAQRWAALADSWLQLLPDDIRRLLSERSHALWGSGLRSYIDWLYPAGGDWMDDRIGTYTSDAELLGITANQAPTGPGSLLLADGVEAADLAMAALLPAEVEQVYLQHDLSVVATGPLTPRVDARLRAIADVESRALASSYRVSLSSVNRAMASGETAESMLEFLRSISITGVPQPLDYLIEEAASRYGLVRAGAIDDDDSVASYLSSTDAHLLTTIMVDQNLSSLRLTRTGDGRLVSRYPLDIVFWSLNDARYPVAAESADGQIVALRRERAARPTVASGADPIEGLIERLRMAGEAEGEDAGQAWLVRQLEVAIKNKTALTVSITMPNGQVLDYQLEPTSVANGRLRARDRKSAIERTLPLSRITKLESAD